MKEFFKIGEKVTANGRPEVLTVTAVDDGYASTQCDHGEGRVTKGYYPLAQLTRVAATETQNSKLKTQNFPAVPLKPTTAADTGRREVNGETHG